MKIKESAENYLEAILVLGNANGRVRSIDVANHLGVSKPSVSVAMKHLRQNDYVIFAPDGEISLTDAGMEIAARVYERHTVITEALCRMGVSVEVAREDACRIEHDISEETFIKLKEWLSR
jgi:Mn-dependent DtxR family transcriptional regulator